MDKIVKYRALSFLLLVSACLLWAIHDAYLWDEITRNAFLGKWHIIKMLMKGSFFASVYILARNKYELTMDLLSYALIYWGAFEFFYTIHTPSYDTPKLFSFFTNIVYAITGKAYPGTEYTSFFEYLLHWGFRLDYASSIIMILVGVAIEIYSWRRYHDKKNNSD